MKISVIIPVFDRQESAVRALRSVLAQDMPEGSSELDVIVVDDGSLIPFTLPSDIAGDTRIRLIRQKNAGASAARNRGIAAAKGEWIAFLDSDDFWTPGKLAHQIRRVATDKTQGRQSIFAYVTGFRQVDLGTGKAKDRIPLESVDPADFASGCWFAPGSTALVPKAAFDRVGLLDESLARLEDLDWYLRLALAGGGVRVVPDVLSIVEVGGKPSPARLAPVIDALRRKWTDADAPLRLDEPANGNLLAYLDIEWASVMRAERRPLAMAAALVHSWVRRPRARLHLRNWWPSEVGSEA